MNHELRINKIKNKGFTLIELLVVLVIIGVLSALLTANFIGVRQRARDAQRKTDLRQIQSALEIYRADNGSYPSSDFFPACGLPFAEEGSVTYMEKVPCDPSTQVSYTYSSGGTPDGTSYSLIACLENGEDSQKDTILPDPNSCNQSTNFAYTLKNP